MASIKELKERINLHDLAKKLGLKQPGGKGNYRSPLHDDKEPSLSISACGKKFNDFSREGDNTSGSCIDLVIHCCDGIDNAYDAKRRLHELYSIPFEEKPTNLNQDTASLVEYLAYKLLSQPVEKASNYLLGRGIASAVISLCQKRRTLGFTNYTKSTAKPGEKFYGGDAVGFVSYCHRTSMVVGVDYRYIDPKLNGGLKTQSHGEKDSAFYFPDPVGFRYAHTVYVVESPVNALSILTAFEKSKGVTAIATKGTKVGGHDWRMMSGKRIIICQDNDEPDENGRRAGQEAAWAIHESLLTHDLACLLVDQSDWEVNDINDYLQASGPEETRFALGRFEPWAIPGLIGREDVEQQYHRRLHLPNHDYSVYWRYRVTPDFTHYITIKTDKSGDTEEQYQDLCGFRLAALSRLLIQDYKATTAAAEDRESSYYFCAQVQKSDGSHQLQRRVMPPENLYDLRLWNKFGPVWKANQFTRLITIFERASYIGERTVANFVGLAFKQGRPTFIEGPDTHFINPKQQCGYRDLTFPGGSITNGKDVLLAYQKTFSNNAASAALVWALGAHLKIFLGFYPHMQMQADKGHGKSTFMSRLEQTVAMRKYSGQSLNTEFRILTSLSHSSQPVAWDELSARKQEIIDKAVSLLQESYNFSVTERGAELLEYVISAPVLLIGEDTPVRDILGKLVRTDLTDRQGPMLPHDLPPFPVKEWLIFLTNLTTEHVQQRLEHCVEHLTNSSLSSSDVNERRMILNYASQYLAWLFLCDFLGIENNTGNFLNDLVNAMNTHIDESANHREPWVWIMEIILGEIDANRFTYPYEITENRDGLLVLYMRATHMMQHLSQTPALKEKFNAMPVKSGRTLKKQIIRSGVVFKESVEKEINGKRYTGMLAIDVNKLEKFGLDVAIPQPTVNDDYKQR